jgi:hypothetical protein
MRQVLHMQKGHPHTYQQAAESAAEIMDLNGGLSNITLINQDHLQFYSNDDVTRG